ncbi:B12-binding domain-containing radical SAM protein [Streptomyces sp. NPDC059255]|uniref:B12-binding domain-containing radical SAM protein n=1 Tax=Streptomyces sp. NPDC059255 TaxID=3346793 RepID=UPI0036850257
MSPLDDEIARITATEVHLGPPHQHAAKPTDRLRVVFLLPYGHPYSLMCLGPLALYHLINTDPDLPAVAERALLYESLLPDDGNRLSLPDGPGTYRSIENPAPVAEADILGVSITNAGDLASVFKLLDLAGIPRRTADRVPGLHPLVIGGSGGFANPEVLADHLDAVVLGEGEQTMTAVIRTIHTSRHLNADRPALLQNLAHIPGLYIPALYEATLRPGGGVLAITPRGGTTPARVRPQYLDTAGLPAAHFTALTIDGETAMIVPTLGCRHSCDFCTLGVPPFRQAPYRMLIDYLERCEAAGVSRVVISSPTFTQYRDGAALLEHLRGWSRRSANGVSVIIGSVRADELTPGYLDAVAGLGDVRHLFTEQNLTAPARGIITIAPEWAAPDLVRIFNKTLTPERVHKAVELCRTHTDFGVIMAYFILGAPGETEADRLAIADYAADLHARLGRDDGAVIIKIQQFMPKPGTTSQRLPMADPDLTDQHVDAIRARLKGLVGAEAFARHFRVLWGESARLHLESICLRGDRRIGHVLEDLHDSHLDLTSLTADQLHAALARHGLRHDAYLRAMDDDVLPWEIVNTVQPEAEQRLRDALAHRTAIAAPQAARQSLPVIQADS